MSNTRRLRECGVMTTEYAVMFVAIAVVIIAASLNIMKPAFSRFYNGAGNIFNDAASHMKGNVGEDESGGTSGGPGGDESGGSSGGPGGDESGGSSGGSGGTGGSGGGTGGGSGGGGSGGDSSGGGTGGTDKKTPVIDGASLDNALESLKTYDAGIEFYNLIESKNISIIYEDMTDSGWWGYWYSPDNKIAINSSLSGSSASLLASIIAHESTHADYAYNPQKWIDSTLGRHTELVLDDLHINTYPYYSLDEEYMAFYETSVAWESLKERETNSYMDSIVSLIAAGEDFTKAYLRSIPDYADLLDY